MTHSDVLETEIQLTGLTLGQSYSFMVAAVNSNGESPMSEPLKIHLLATPSSP